MNYVSRYRLAAVIAIMTTATLYSTPTLITPLHIATPVNCIASASSSPIDGLPKKYTETIMPVSGGKITFDMVLIPGGEFMMGSSDKEAGRKEDEGPQHKIRLGPFICA